MELLEEYTDETEILQLTTDPLIVYDWLTEEWVVQVDDKTEARLYGGNRASRAKQLANLIRVGAYGICQG